jgi:hypothetical protein
MPEEKEPARKAICTLTRIPFLEQVPQAKAWKPNLDLGKDGHRRAGPPPELSDSASPKPQAALSGMPVE